MFSHLWISENVGRSSGSQLQPRNFTTVSYVDTFKQLIQFQISAHKLAYNLQGHLIKTGFQKSKFKQKEPFREYSVKLTKYFLLVTKQNTILLTHILSSFHTPPEDSPQGRAFCTLSPTFHTLETGQFLDRVTCHMLQVPTRVFQML